MKILKVDLTCQRLTWDVVGREHLQSYLGGRGLGVRYLYDMQPGGVDPLGPDNHLTIWTSPLMGSGAISMVKTCGVTRSPATGTILMSLMGGYFGIEMRFAGVDGLVLRGVSDQPVYLLIQDGEASLRPAAHLWGMSTCQTRATLQKELSLHKMQVACIGTAGENRVLFASIMHGGDAMGRGGIGAVMGAKGLKAIVVSGRQKPAMHDPQAFEQALDKVIQTYKDCLPLELFGATGTTRHVDGLNARRIYPTRNFQTNHFEEYQQVNAETLYKNFVKRRVTCHTCTVRCRRESKLSASSDCGQLTTEGPEYETLWGFSGNCGNASLESVIAANELCLEYGLDTISTSTVISFAMECYENGLLGKSDTDGLELRFGNSVAIIELIHKIAHRQGIGQLLSLGTRQAARQIGGGAEDFAMQVKGLELAGYDPRGAKGMGLGYATSPRGGCHERGYLLGEVALEDPAVNRYGYEGKGELVKTTQDTVAVKDALGFCVLSSAGTSLGDMAALYSAATGIHVQECDLLEAGERICNLERLFNLREGFTRADDDLPLRFIREAARGVDGELHTVDIDCMITDYYQARGWDETGRPLVDTLTRLGLP